MKPTVSAMMISRSDATAREVAGDHSTRSEGHVLRVAEHDVDERDSGEHGRVNGPSDHFVFGAADHDLITNVCLRAPIRGDLPRRAWRPPIGDLGRSEPTRNVSDEHDLG